MNLREKILGEIAKPMLEPLDIPEWGGTTVYLAALTVGEQKRLFEKDEKDKTDSISLLRSALRDESGKPLFTDSEADTAFIKDIPLVVTERILTRWADYNRITAKAVEEAEKN